MTAAGSRAVQVDATSCGAASLLVARARLDPRLAAHLTTVPGAFAAAQVRVRDATARRALGPWPWPRSLGTPPWTAARVLATADVRFRTIWLPARDLDEEGLRAVVARIAAHAADGLPVPLYVGHPLLARTTARGWGERGPVVPPLSRLPALPRHVVVAVAGDATTLEIYEPGFGELHRITAEHLIAVARTPEAPAAAAGRRALGGWTRLAALLEPERVAAGADDAAPWGDVTAGAGRPGAGSARQVKEDL